MRLLVARLPATLRALTWLVFPGFGLIDLGVTWDPEWPVVLEAGWGVFMALLVGGSFLALAIRPTRGATSTATLLVALVALLVSAGAGLEWRLLGYAAVLSLQGTVVLLVPQRERLRPLARATSLLLAALAVAAAPPWLLYAARMYRLNRGAAGEAIGELEPGEFRGQVVEAERAL